MSLVADWGGNREQLRIRLVERVEAQLRCEFLFFGMVQLRISFFWGVTLLVWVVGSLHFEEVSCPRFRGSKFLKTLLPLKMRAVSIRVSKRYGILRSSRGGRGCVHNQAWHILSIPLFCTCSMAVVAVGLWHTKLLFAVLFNPIYFLEELCRWRRP